MQQHDTNKIIAVCCTACGLDVAQICKLTGVSVSTLYKYLAPPDSSNYRPANLATAQGVFLALELYAQDSEWLRAAREKMKTLL